MKIARSTLGTFVRGWHREWSSWCSLLLQVYNWLSTSRVWIGWGAKVWWPVHPNIESALVCSWASRPLPEDKRFNIFHWLDFVTEVQFQKKLEASLLRSPQHVRVARSWVVWHITIPSSWDTHLKVSEHDHAGHDVSLSKILPADQKRLGHVEAIFGNSNFTQLTCDTEVQQTASCCRLEVLRCLIFASHRSGVIYWLLKAPGSQKTTRPLQTLVKAIVPQQECHIWYMMIYMSINLHKTPPQHVQSRPGVPNFVAPSVAAHVQTFRNRRQVKDAKDAKPVKQQLIPTLFRSCSPCNTSKH